ncbi:heat shock 70 kDa protein 3-like [Papaver somniferum]|uniref:heat shock 70 kDa protein 3-like n=1 Tax=Papaver somniferum TaxID=3469 RepID=UPI000E6FF16C|nr:heat shock 70 kDa protein 3-like [Papaver somniferum]
MEANFITISDNQTRMWFPVYEGERTIASKNDLLGKFSLWGIPPAPRGVGKVKICFDLDANGILNVSAMGNQKQITIRNDKGRFSKAEIDRLVQEALLYKSEDDEHRKKVVARNSFEHYTYDMRNTMDSLGEKIESDDKKKIMDAVNDAIQWLDSNELTDVGVTKDKMKVLQNICNPIIAKLNQQGGTDNGSSARASNAAQKFWKIPEILISFHFFRSHFMP